MCTCYMEKVNWIGNPNVEHIKRSLYFELNGWKSDKVIILLVFSNLWNQQHKHIVLTLTSIFHFANPSVENMWEAHFNCRVIRSYTHTIEAVASKIAAAIKNEVRPLWNRTLGRSLRIHNDRRTYIIRACVCLSVSWSLFVCLCEQKEGKKCDLFVRICSIHSVWTPL